MSHPEHAQLVRWWHDQYREVRADLWFTVFRLLVILAAIGLLVGPAKEYCAAPPARSQLGK